MDFLSKDLTTELLSIFGVIGSACLVSYSFGNNERSLFERIFKRRNKIDNIYQLLPILQKNSKKLFLFFTDLATSIKAVSSPNDANITRELVEGILSQEFYKNKVLELQNEVFDGFNVDSKEVQKAISKFAEDDQVEFYALGVKRMFESVLIGNYPQCPGIEPNSEITEGKLLEILEKLAIAKTKNWLKNGNQLLNENEPLKDPEFEDIILKEMSKFGCDNMLDAVVTIKNSENYFNYYPNFERARIEILSKVRKVYNSTDVQKVSGEELQLVLSTCEKETTVLVLVYDDLINENSFNKLVRISTSKNPIKKLDELFNTCYSQTTTTNGDLINKPVKENKKTDIDGVYDLDTNPSIDDNLNGSVVNNYSMNGDLTNNTNTDNGTSNIDEDNSNKDNNNNTNNNRDNNKLELNGSSKEEYKEEKEKINNEMKKINDITNATEFNKMVESMKINQENIKLDEELIKNVNIENVVTLWIFKEEYKETKNIKQCPVLIVFKGGKMDIIEKV